MIYLLLYKVASTRIEIERSIPNEPQTRVISNTFNTLVPPATMNAEFAMNMMLAASVLAELPNERFINAIDISNIETYIGAMDPPVRSEIEEVLEDQEAFMALSSKVILDLLENEPDTYTIEDVKVRFR